MDVVNQFARRVVLLGGFCCVGGILLAACGGSDGGTAGAPVIELETVAYDFGMIEPDEIAETFVTIYNRGTAPLVINKITTDCHCTEGEMLEEVVPAGGEGLMRVTVDPSRVAGSDSVRRLTLFTNDPASPAAIIDIAAKIKSDYELSADLLALGEVVAGETVIGAVRLRQMRNSPLIFTNAPSINKRFMSVELIDVPESEWRSPGKAEYDIVVTATGTGAPGPREGTAAVLIDVRDRFVKFGVTMTVVAADGSTTGS